MVRFAISGDLAVERALGLLGERSSDLSEPLARLQEQILAGVEVQFQTEGLGRWRPISPAYLAWKERHWPGRGPQVLTGSLKRYLTSERSVPVQGDRLRALLPAELYKLEDRPIVSAGTAEQADAVFEAWMAGVVRRTFPGSRG